LLKKDSTPNITAVLEFRALLMARHTSMTGRLLRTTFGLVLAAILQPATARARADAKDWPTYNHDVLGSRYNQGEKAISRDNTGRLEEKWRFPAQGSGQEIGAIHATPVIVGGYVYIGTTAASPPHAAGMMADVSVFPLL
jgi:glucose dehydrogenase